MGELCAARLVLLCHRPKTLSSLKPESPNTYAEKEHGKPKQDSRFGENINHTRSAQK